MADEKDPAFHRQEAAALRKMANKYPDMATHLNNRAVLADRAAAAFPRTVHNPVTPVVKRAVRIKP